MTAFSDHVKAPILTFHGHPVPGASNQVFYLGMTPTRQGEVLAKGVAEMAKAQRVIIVQDERRAEATALAEAFQKTLADDAAKKPAGSGATIVTVRFGKDANWIEILDRIQTPAPQAVVFAGAVQDFNAWLRKPRLCIFRWTICRVLFASAQPTARSVSVRSRGRCENVSVDLATAFYADPASDKIQAFLKAFREMPAKTEADVNAILACTTGLRHVGRGDEAKIAAPQVTPERIREELAKTKEFPGLTGPLTITAERQMQRPLFVMRWQNGVPTTLVKAFP